jgi:hypothetical protein
MSTGVTVENGANQFSQTSACGLGADGKYRLHEIRIGSTITRILFNGSSEMAVGR